MHGWRFEMREAMMATALEYIEVFYDRKRLHSTLSCKLPTQFLRDRLSAQQMEKQVASNQFVGRRKTSEKLGGAVDGVSRKSKVSSGRGFATRGTPLSRR